MKTKKKKRPLNATEKKYFKYLCIWSHFCTKQKKLKKGIEADDYFKTLICMKPFCSMRDRMNMNLI